MWFTPICSFQFIGVDFEENCVKVLDMLKQDIVFQQIPYILIYAGIY